MPLHRKSICTSTCIVSQKLLNVLASRLPHSWWKLGNTQKAKNVLLIKTYISEAHHLESCKDRESPFIFRLSRMIYSRKFLSWPCVLRQIRSPLFPCKEPVVEVILKTTLLVQCFLRIQTQCAGVLQVFVSSTYPLGGSTIMALGFTRSEEIRVRLWLPFSIATSMVSSHESVQ